MKKTAFKSNGLLKNIFITILFIGFVLIYWQLDGQKRLQYFVLDNSPMTSAEFLEVFEIDSKEACKEKDQNKYNLPEQECINKIYQYSNICKTQTAEKFPGRVNTIKIMLLIGNAYTSCVFSKKEE